MELNKEKSKLLFLYKFIKNEKLYDDPPKTLCPLFWMAMLSVLSIIISPIYNICFFIRYKFSKRDILINNYRHHLNDFYIFMFDKFIIVGYMLASFSLNTFFNEHCYQVPTYLTFSVLWIILPLIVSLIVLALGYILYFIVETLPEYCNEYIKNRKYKEVDSKNSSSKFNIIKEVIISTYKRYCPKIDWK